MSIQLFNRFQQNKAYKQLAVNAFAMLIIQVSNYLIPIITFPYLLRTLGIEGFGIMSFTQNIFSYFEQFLNYGFVYAAPRDIAQNTEDKAHISQTFHSIVYTKIVLLAVCLVILIPLFAFVPRLTSLHAVALSGLSILVANVLQIDWFFQGIQQMKNITYANVLARMVSLILLFSFVKSPNNVAEALLAISISQILANIFLWLLAYQRHGITFVPPQYELIKKQLEGGFAIFSSQFLVRFYSADVNLTLLGFFTNNVTVGTYAIANKIFSLVALVISPINAALYPYLAKLFSTDYAAFWRQFYRFVQLYALLYVSLAVGLFLSADFIITLINGAPNVLAATLLRFLSLAIAVAPFGSLFVQALLLHKKDRILFYINLMLVALNLVSVVPLFLYFQEIGLAINTILMHWVIVGSLFFIVYRLKNVPTT